jgi:hypothetical protein
MPSRSISQEQKTQPDTNGPLLPLSPRLFAAVQLPDCGHLFGVRHLDDELATVGISQTFALTEHRVFNLVKRAKKPVCFQGNGKPQE